MLRLVWLFLIALLLTEKSLSSSESMIDKAAAQLIDRPLNKSLNDSSLQSSTLDEIEPIQVTFEPKMKAELAAQIASPVVKIYKLLGESFEKGDILIKLEDSFYRANVEKGLAAVEKAKSILHAKNELFKESLAPFLDVKDAESLLATAKADLAFAKKQWEACTVYAPFTGKVASLLISEFELPQPGQSLIEIIGDDILIGRMLVDANYWNKVEVNQMLNIKVNETNQSIRGRVVRIGPMIDLSSSSLKVEMEIHHKDTELIAGMTGVTTLNEEKISDANMQNQPLVNSNNLENRESIR